MRPAENRHERTIEAADGDDALQETIIDDDLLEAEAEQVGRRPRRGEFISLREFMLFMLWVRPYKDSAGTMHPMPLPRTLCSTRVGLPSR